VEKRLIPVDKLKKILQFGFSNKIFFPLHVNGNHWILVCINWETCQLDMYCPLNNRYPDVMFCLKRRINDIIGANKYVMVNQHYDDHDIMRQFDSHSCGFFVCWYAYQLASGLSLSKWTNCKWAKEIERISENVMISLIEKKILM